MSDNLVRKVYAADATWTAPGGVTSVTAITIPLNQVLNTNSYTGNNFAAIDSLCNGYAWGNNICGSLGNGSITVACLPTSISCSFKWRVLSAGWNCHMTGVITVGDAYAWGSNECGALGVGSITVACLPTLVCCGLKWKTISAGGATNQPVTTGITTAGDGYAWGNNSFGQFGNGSTTTACLPSLICCGFKWKQIFAGSSHAMGINTLCDAYGWGSNSCGVLGIGTTGGTGKCLPVLVCCGIKWKQIVSTGLFTTGGLAVDGTAYAWGSNVCGAVGDGSVTLRNLPVPVSGGLKFKQLAAGGCVMVGITTAGDAYAWGSNVCGALGNGSITVACVPTLVCCGLKWKYINVGLQSVYGITTDGDMYAWGNNNCGQLGNGSITVACLPTLVCCGLKWLPLVQQQRRTYEVTPGLTYNVKVFTRFSGFQTDPITDDVSTDAVVLEYLA